MRKIFFVISVLLVMVIPARAQRDRISGQIDRQRVAALRGNVHPRAQAGFDQGLLDPATQIHLVTLMLKPSASQQAALDHLLVEQQNPASPNYHKWLTPEDYADRFGASASDMAKISAWLESEGFSIDHVSRGRNWLVFHGTAGQIQSSLHTEMHRYRLDGKLHFANSTEPSVPAAIEPLVMNILGLHDVQPNRIGRRRLLQGSIPGSLHPNYTVSQNMLAPSDFAAIYDLNPLYKAGFDGAGQRIVIAGQIDVDLADIHSFRSMLALPANDPQLLLAPGSPDPGTDAYQLGEADLDIEWSGAVARNANIIYVYSTNAFASALYAISQNLAPVISLSYGTCETYVSPGEASGMRMAAQAGAAQGITWLSASGDSGPADCDYQGDPTNFAATQISVDFPPSIPEVTAVGGTQFDEGNGSYWSPSGAALSYIPEVAWNESSPVLGLAASGGGLSSLYSKPAWQTGPGVPTANARAVPDVSLNAAVFHDPAFIFTGGMQAFAGGTSVAAPAFAGLIAILNQYQVANGGSLGQGNINPALYSLAQTATGVFHDITGGNNIVPCISSVTGCSSGFFGYSAGPGYDLVTGLGSVDANNLITQWTKSAGSAKLQAPYHLQPFFGEGQVGVPSSVLPTPLVVSAQDANGQPVPGITVTFSAALGGGSVSPTTAVTDSGGLAQTQMTLGRATGTQMVVASAAQFASTGMFEFSSSSGAAPSFSLGYGRTGNAQTAPAGSALPTPITITVIDSRGALLPGIPIAWLVTGGGGTVAPLAAVTDSTGRVSANWTLGSSVGSQTVQAIPFYFNGASLYDFHGTTFTATALPVGAYSSVQPYYLQPFSGDTQLAAAGSVLPKPLVVVARDANGVPVSGVAVSFTVTLGGGSVSPVSAVTDVNGLAQTQMTLGPTQGVQMVLASGNQVASTGVMEFAGVSSGFSYLTSGNFQSGSVNAPLSAPLSLTVLDSQGRPMPSIPVAWLVTAGGGTVTPLAAVTDSKGTVGANWTLGSLAGIQTLQAIPFSYGGASLYNFTGKTFTAAAQGVFSGSPVPTIASLSPASTTAGGAGFTLTVTGVNFVSSSVIQWNGKSRPTNFIDSTQLVMGVTAADVASAGTAQITVLNPAPGGGTSTALTFTIGNSPPPVPTINSGGVLNNASYAKPPVLAPGMLVEVFGANLTDGTTAYAPSSTLPVRVAGARLLVNGFPAALSFASPRDIRGQLPVEIAGATNATVQVEVQTANGTVTGPSITISISPFAPGIFTWDSNGAGPGAIMRNSDFSKICPAGRSDCPANAAARGDVVVIFMTGLGQVNGSWVTGQPNPVALATTTTPLVTIGGMPAQVESSVLAVGYPGLYQVNVDVPPNTPTGDSVPVIVSIGGIKSNTVMMAVK